MNGVGPQCVYRKFGNIASTENDLSGEALEALRPTVDVVTRFRRGQREDYGTQLGGQLGGRRCSHINWRWRIRTSGRAPCTPADDERCRAREVYRGVDAQAERPGESLT